ncbi:MULTISPECIES: right-handed parallel beta-helix repeat-containing protein [Paenibacillus]|uniref:right-handed parallel beta-helix repeat-containing protein n=1 Tax=Paenibacillus TaxID=44249 RepID=UPI0022B87B1B|nr:NosD domain-containing protein [Paenibacillus caseinilyticus]MCZ8523046.1 right-handed parallel beta-helix repeat-containing protein [Paenibacillus caseinilyticus]
MMMSFSGITAKPVTAEADPLELRSLQQLIDITPPGGTLKLDAGNYAGPAKVNKQLSIIGEENAVIVNESSLPAITITVQDVRLKNLRIDHEGKEDRAAVLIAANRAAVQGIDIKTESYGIVIRDSEGHTIENSHIAHKQPGAADNPVSDRKNGIDLFNSHNSRIAGNVIDNMHDGIYLESSHRNVIEGNRIEHSRYGVHCMYTDGTVISRNEGAFNVTGAMVMGVNDAIVKDNTFVKQSESVNSQGFLFFDVHTSIVYNNTAQGNRVGLYVEQSDRNEFTNNDVLGNFTGVQFLESQGNRFTDNRFIGNVIEAEASDSENNSFRGNYWEAFRGIDVSGDAISDTAYRVNPFFQRLTSAVPAFQLYFQSPGMLFLESLHMDGIETWTKDEAPRMRHDFRNAQSQLPLADHSTSGMLALGLALLAASLFTIYYLGVRR